MTGYMVRIPGQEIGNLGSEGKWAHSTESQLYPRPHQNCGQQLEGGDSLLLLCSGEIHPKYCVQLWGLQLKKDTGLLKQV